MVSNYGLSCQGSDSIVVENLLRHQPTIYRQSVGPLASSSQFEMPPRADGGHSIEVGVIISHFSLVDNVFSLHHSFNNAALSLLSYSSNELVNLNPSLSNHAVPSLLWRYVFALPAMCQLFFVQAKTDIGLFVVMTGIVSFDSISILSSWYLSRDT